VSQKILLVISIFTLIITMGSSTGMKQITDLERSEHLMRIAVASKDKTNRMEGYLLRSFKITDTWKSLYTVQKKQHALELKKIQKAIKMLSVKYNLK